MFNCKDQTAANPLDLDQWRFYVLSAKKLDLMLPDQKSATRLSVIQKIGAINSDYSGLREAIRSEFSAE